MDKLSTIMKAWYHKPDYRDYTLLFKIKKKNRKKITKMFALTMKKVEVYNMCIECEAYSVLRQRKP